MKELRERKRERERRSKRRKSEQRDELVDKGTGGEKEERKTKKERGERWWVRRGALFLLFIRPGFFPSHKFERPVDSRSCLEPGQGVSRCCVPSFSDAPATRCKEQGTCVRPSDGRIVSVCPPRSLLCRWNEGNSARSKEQAEIERRVIAGPLRTFQTHSMWRKGGWPHGGC